MTENSDVAIPFPVMGLGMSTENIVAKLLATTKSVKNTNIWKMIVDAWLGSPINQ